MKSARHLLAVLPVVMLASSAAAVPLRPVLHSAAGVVPAVSSNAHRSDSSGNYGAYKGRSPPPFSARSIGPGGIKQPYPYRYYYDTNRSISGCRWMARRAIETNSRTWWARYRACRN